MPDRTEVDTSYYTWHTASPMDSDHMVCCGFPYEVLQGYHKTLDFVHIVHGVHRQIPLDIL